MRGTHSDVIGLSLAWFAVWLSRKQPSAAHSYGLGRSSILATLAKAVLLLVAVVVIVSEALHEQFDIDHATIQIETGEMDCAHAHCRVTHAG